jgi:Family of unknown function (DUF5995)
MSDPASDQMLLPIISNPHATTIDDVIAVMQSIDGTLPAQDGLKWFNFLYLQVTKEVRDHPPTQGWEDSDWLTHLDLVFASLYFGAIADLLNQRQVPSSWQALFEARHTTGIDRIQFALAGMNAHINHDLPLALLQTDDELHLTPSLNSPQHDDYERVNDLLENVLPSALHVLATGPLGEAAEDTGKIGRLLAIWDVRVARDLAWGFADHLRNLPGMSRQIALDVQDRITGALGRSLLLPFTGA